MKGLKAIPTSDKDHSAAVVVQRWLDFQNALSSEGKYPVAQFKSFVNAARRYIELSKGDPLAVYSDQDLNKSVKF